MCVWKNILTVAIMLFAGCLESNAVVLSESVPYGVGDWSEKLGNHRAVIAVDGDSSATPATWIHIPWRRRDAKPFPDACVTTTWIIDLHYPKKAVCACETFQSEARQLKIKPYPIPYRCLYSRNISNLMMAGRNISVTHVALGTVRVMCTTGMMGEVLGMAEFLCKKNSCDPCGVYEKNLLEFKEILKQGPLPAQAPIAGNPVL